MYIKDFSVDGYVKRRLKDIEIASLAEDEYDKIIDKEETFRRNIRNLLKHFPEKYELNPFKFEIDVFKFFPLNHFDDESISHFLDHIFKFKGESNMVGNKLLSNLNKITVDNRELSVDGKWRNFEFFYIKEQEQSEFAAQNIANKEKYRDIIRRNPRSAKLISYNFKIQIANLKKSNNLSDLSAIIDLGSDIILQMINYWVITIGDINFDKKVILVNKIEAFLSNFENKIVEIGIENNLKIDIADAVTIFVGFLERRNEFGEYVNIINDLMDEEKNDSEFFDAVPNAYKLNKKSRYDDVKYKEIILEGKYIDQFDKKLEYTKVAIDIFQKYGGRIADVGNLLDQKVYFREIYLSNSKYKVKASTIIRKMLVEFKKSGNPDSYDKASEYMFLREKISRGYFRETSNLELYHLKNKLQVIVYKTLITSMLCYSYERSLDLLDELIEGLTPLCFCGIDDLLESVGEPRIFKKSVPVQ